MFDYFYGIQSEQFAFYRIPKILFTDDRFRVLSAEAKTLYGILLDRVTLSAKNGWIDQQGRVYIIYTIEEIMFTDGHETKVKENPLNENFAKKEFQAL